LHALHQQEVIHLDVKPSNVIIRPGGEAVLIDTVYEQVARDQALLRELGLQLVATLETHVHADHVTGAWLHRQRRAVRP
jgi:glyoxylase-like metal-dependent hydrolase (beta-lactamase superfamily II)